jgi:hypothetical protein
VERDSKEDFAKIEAKEKQEGQLKADTVYVREDEWIRETI